MRNGQLIFLAAAILLTAPLLFGQQPPAEQPSTPMQMHHDPGDMQPMDCQGMVDKMRTMHASMKAMDDKLAGLVDAMNKAKGSAKVDRMAAVINEMVAQRNHMRDQMATMMPQMMQHMIVHMQGGVKSEMKSIADCPMMKSGDGKTPPPATEHKH